MLEDATPPTNRQYLTILRSLVKIVERSYLPFFSRRFARYVRGPALLQAIR
jgi:hypothetical protein